MAMLRLEHVMSNYGSINALRDISFEVNEGEIVTLIGANGAGKTTTMHSIAGLKNINGGKIYYEDKDISKWEAQTKVKTESCSHRRDVRYFRILRCLITC